MALYPDNNNRPPANRSESFREVPDVDRTPPESNAEI